MAGRTISAHADELIVERMHSLAKAEDRPVSQLVSASVRFYMKLPPEAHAALRTIEAFATAEEEAMALRGVVRALAAAELKISERRMTAQLRLDNEAQLGSDDAILAEAVRLTRRR
jgi:hypothetical protein